MAENRSEKSCYESRFGAGWITSAQYLAENMCDRKARSEGNGLKQKFWQDVYWEKQLKIQLKHANDLLKEFDISSILAALKHPDAKRIYSLGFKSLLVPLIRREQKLRNLREKETKIKTLPSVDITQKPRQPFAKGKSPLQKLRDLENG